MYLTQLSAALYPTLAKAAGVNKNVLSLDLKIDRAADEKYLWQTVPDRWC